MTSRCMWARLPTITCAKYVPAITLPSSGTVVPTDAAPPTQRPTNGFLSAAAVVSADLAGNLTAHSLPAGVMWWQAVLAALPLLSQEVGAVAALELGAVDRAG